MTVNLHRPLRRRDTTDNDIRQLANEAASHGDLEMHALCERALAGDVPALIKVQAALLDADAQRDDGAH